jgi:hypothetical protein
MANKVFYSRVSYQDAYNKAQQAGFGRVVGKTFNGKQYVVFAQPQQSFFQRGLGGRM